VLKNRRTEEEASRENANRYVTIWISLKDELLTELGKGMSKVDGIWTVKKLFLRCIVLEKLMLSLS
jgi:hypothetical protein